MRLGNPFENNINVGNFNQGLSSLIPLIEQKLVSNYYENTVVPVIQQINQLIGKTDTKSNFNNITTLKSTGTEYARPILSPGLGGLIAPNVNQVPRIYNQYTSSDLLTTSINENNPKQAQNQIQPYNNPYFILRNR